MATYEIPRNVKGESRILFIFTTKSLIYSAVAGAVRTYDLFHIKFNWTILGGSGNTDFFLC